MFEKARPATADLLGARANKCRRAGDVRLGPWRRRTRGWAAGVARGVERSPTERRRVSTAGHGPPRTQVADPSSRAARATACTPASPAPLAALRLDCAWAAARPTARRGATVPAAPQSAPCCQLGQLLGTSDPPLSRLCPLPTPARLSNVAVAARCGFRPRRTSRS